MATSLGSGSRRSREKGASAEEALRAAHDRAVVVATGADNNSVRADMYECSPSLPLHYQMRRASMPKTPNELPKPAIAVTQVLKITDCMLHFY